MRRVIRESVGLERRTCATLAARTWATRSQFGPIRSTCLDRRGARRANLHFWLYRPAVFAVIYRWTLKPGTEDRFRDAWRTMTEAILARSGTSGSRLHRTDNGEVVAYAVWPSRERWEAAGKLPPASAEALTTMRDCIETSHGATPLTLLDDLLE